MTTDADVDAIVTRLRWEYGERLLLRWAWQELARSNAETDENAGADDDDDGDDDG